MVHPNSDSLVSVIMPAHNAAETVAESVQSVLDQTQREWELLIVNDRSTDQTDQIIREFVAFDRDTVKFRG